MRKIYPLLFLFSVVAVFSCAEDTVVDVISLNAVSMQMITGDKTRLTADVLPANPGVVWASSDETVAMVDEAGLVEAVSEGEAVITAASGGMTAECLVTVLTVPEVGDIYYSDGTWSPYTKIDRTKAPVAVIYWLGDPTIDDPALRDAHPDCRHGLAVSIKDYSGLAWMRNRQKYYETHPLYEGTVSRWLEANVPQSGTIFSEQGLHDNLNKTVGFYNTRLIEIFASASENSVWGLETYDCLSEIRDDIPLPKTCSGWYIPSIRELVLLAAGDLSRDINIMSLNAETENLNNMKTVGRALTAAGGDALQAWDYWSSTESISASGVNRIIYPLDMSYGYLYLENMSSASMSACFRPVLAF